MIVRLHREITTFYAGEGLLVSLSDWASRHDGFSLRLLATPDPEVVRQSVAGVTLAVFDATERPGAAMAALEEALRQVPPRLCAVYTEAVHHGLEVFTRVRGVQMLLGPLDALEWDAVLEPLVQAPPVVPRLRRA